MSDKQSPEEKLHEEEKRKQSKKRHARNEAKRIDVYVVLGVSQAATKDEIRAVYRVLSRKLHPDHGGNEEQFKEASNAWSILGDPDSRNAYDQARAEYLLYLQQEKEKQAKKAAALAADLARKKKRLEDDETAARIENAEWDLKRVRVTPPRPSATSSVRTTSSRSSPRPTPKPAPSVAKVVVPKPTSVPRTRVASQPASTSTLQPQQKRIRIRSIFHITLMFFALGFFIFIGQKGIDEYIRFKQIQAQIQIEEKLASEEAAENARAEAREKAKNDAIIAENARAQELKRVEKIKQEQEEQERRNFNLKQKKELVAQIIKKLHFGVSIQKKVSRDLEVTKSSRNAVLKTLALHRWQDNDYHTRHYYISREDLEERIEANKILIKNTLSVIPKIDIFIKSAENRVWFFDNLEFIYDNIESKNFDPDKLDENEINFAVLSCELLGETLVVVKKMCVVKDEAIKNSPKVSVCEGNTSWGNCERVISMPKIVYEFRKGFHVFGHERLIRIKDGCINEDLSIQCPGDQKMYSIGVPGYYSLYTMIQVDD